LIFDNDPNNFPGDEPTREDAIIEEWLEIIQTGLSITTAEADSRSNHLAEELEHAKSALKRARSKRSG
jgi:hypothetical protein